MQNSLSVIQLILLIIGSQLEPTLGTRVPAIEPGSYALLVERVTAWHRRDRLPALELILADRTLLVDLMPFGVVKGPLQFL